MHDGEDYQDWQSYGTPHDIPHLRNYQYSAKRSHQKESHQVA